MTHDTTVNRDDTVIGIPW